MKFKNGSSVEQINQTLQVNALFWDRDSHGLFDYESKNLKVHDLTVLGCAQLVNDENNLKTTMPKFECPESYQKLLSLVYKNGSYWVYHVQTLYRPDGELDEKLSHFAQAWQIVRL